MREVMILGGLLALSLVASYRTWTAPEEEARRTDVLVVQAEDDDITSVTWKDEESTIVLARKKDARGAYFWVDLKERQTVKKPEPPKPAEGEPPAETPPEPAPEVKETAMQFLGNETAQEVWDGFTPLYAMRELELGPDADLAAYGLDAPKITIEVVKGSEKLTFEVGAESFGTKDRYVRYNGKLYLLDDKFLRPLQSAKSRLVERRLFPVEDKAIETVEVTAGNGTRTFVQKNPDDPAAKFFADKSSPDKKDSEGTAWVEKVLRVRLKSYVADSELKGTPEPVMTFKVTAGKESWVVEIARVGSGAEATYYARAEFTRSWVELTRSLIQDPVEDLASLFDGQDQAVEGSDDVPPSEGAPGGAPPAPAGGPPGAPPIPATPPAPGGASATPPAPPSPPAPPAPH